MASQITATLPTLDFPKEVDYPTQEDWTAFSAAAELNFGILGNGWSTQMQLWKTEANAMSIELNNSAVIAQGLANYQGDWTSKGYTLGQLVSVSGIYYICKLTHATGQNPTDVSSLYWNLAIGNWNLKVDTNMSGYTSKTTPVDADLIPLSDSASSFGIKKLTWANVKATLKTYFDTLYLALTGAQTVDGVKTFSSSPIVPTPTTNTQAANKAYVDSASPAGTIITFASATAPDGHLKANGALVSRTVYSDLFAAIGTTFGAGNGSTTFALPDLRGYFPRGWDDGRGIDTSRAFGSNQGDGYLNHSHTASETSAGAHTHTIGIGGYDASSRISTSVSDGTSLVSSTTSSSGAHTHTITVATSTTGATETRPKNIALLYCIKY